MVKEPFHWILLLRRLLRINGHIICRVLRGSELDLRVAPRTIDDEEVAMPRHEVGQFEEEGSCFGEGGGEEFV